MMRRTVALLATAAMLALPTPALADEAPRSQTPIAPATLASWAQAKQLLQDLEASVGSLPASGTQSSQVDGIATDLVGWTLAAVGLAVDSGSAEEVAQGLDEISAGLSGVQSSLNTISDQLSQLSMELAALSEQEKWVNCSEQTQGASADVAVIQAAADGYNQFLTQSTNATSSEPAPDVDALVDWAEIYTQDNSLMTALEGINTTLMGTADDSSLQACAAALFGMYQNWDLGFESAYYTPLYQYLSYWYQMQVQGLNLFVEAEHTLALDAAGQLTGFQPTQPSEICTENINGQVTQACELAYNQVTTVYDNLAAQIYAAGAPYLWGTGGMVSAPLPTTSTKAWVVDINDFQPGECTLPLTSTSTPCGGTVGTTEGFAETTWGPFTWGSYSGWQPAKTADWLDMFPTTYQTGNWVPFWQGMINAGFGDSTWGAGAGVQNLILYTGEVTSSTNPYLSANAWQEKPTSTFQNSLAGMCLLDTSSNLGAASSSAVWVQPLCDDAQGGILSALVTNFNTANSTWNFGGGNNYSGGGPFTSTSFYDVAFSEGPKDSPWWINQVPGWMTWTYGLYGQQTPADFSYTPAPQYRWPVLPLTSAMCTATPPGSDTQMSLTTASGAYTMCGDDFEAWLAAQLPPAPVPMPAVSLTADARLGAAVVSWRPAKGQRHVTGYRIRGRRDGAQWRTVKTVPSTKSTRVPVQRAGWWQFKVVTLVRDRKSRPSKPSRPEYVTVTKHQWRYYTFRRGQTIRIAKAFSDGRVYFAGRHESGVGQIRKGTLRGHTYRNPYRWSGRWVQPVGGSWKRLQWDGWTRVKGPATSRKGMPLKKAPLARW